MQRNLHSHSAVFLTRLRLQNFRNFEDEIVTLPPAGAAISGANAQGKTNLLEAVYYLTMFRSFCGARDEQLVRFGADLFRVEARASAAGGAGGAGGGEQAIAAAFDRVTGTKRVTVNGAAVPRLADAVGRLPAVIFTGADVELVRGAPALRRRFLDIALSLARPAYLAALQRFRRALAQRNEALRRGARPAEVAAWDEAVAQPGGAVAAERARWVRENADAFCEHYAAISGGTPARLSYAGRLEAPGADDPEACAAAYRAALEASRSRDRLRRVTSVGPHRDDLELRVEKEGEAIDLRRYGSGGEQRTAAIALRLTEAHWLREATGREPIALLDDVFGELDERRVQGILDLLGRRGPGQVILTAPGPVDAAAFGRELAPLVVERGRLRGALSAVSG